MFLCEVNRGEKYNSILVIFIRMAVQKGKYRRCQQKKQSELWAQSISLAKWENHLIDMKIDMREDCEHCM